jgi:hypothetical protein
MKTELWLVPLSPKDEPTKKNLGRLPSVPMAIARLEVVWAVVRGDGRSGECQGWPVSFNSLLYPSPPFSHQPRTTEPQGNAAGAGAGRAGCVGCGIARAWIKWRVRW